MAIRAGKGDADLVQDVSDLLLLCAEHEKGIHKAPRGEVAAVARLRELSPLLARMLADKELSPEALLSRKVRDAAYTLVVNAERRLRAAAEYWYAGTHKMKRYAPFPTSRGAASAREGEEGEAGATDEGAADEGETEAEAADEGETDAEATQDVDPGEDDER